MARAIGHGVRKTHVVKVAGASDELLGEAAFRQILAQIHEQGRSLPDTEEELDAFFDKVRDEVYAGRQAAKG